MNVVRIEADGDVDFPAAIGVGRDASDAAFATIYGDAEFKGMSVGIDAVDGDAEAEEPTTRAVGVA